MNLFINNELVTVDKVQVKGQASYPRMGQWLAVYVNGFASCHSIPAEWFEAKDRRICTTGGNSYQWKRQEIK